MTNSDCIIYPRKLRTFERAYKLRTLAHSPWLGVYLVIYIYSTIRYGMVCARDSNQVPKSARLPSHPCNHGQPISTSSLWAIFPFNPSSHIDYSLSTAQILASPASNGFKHLRAVRRGRRSTAAGLQHANIAATRMGTGHRGYGCHQDVPFQKLLQGSGMWLWGLCGEFN